MWPTPKFLALACFGHREYLSKRPQHLGGAPFLPDSRTLVETLDHGLGVPPGHSVRLFSLRACMRPVELAECH